MFELLYTSVAPQCLSEDELMDILLKARIKNQQLGITGMMIYHDREIMQILEGDESAVKALYQTICEDQRHTRVNIFYEGHIEERAFPEWSMAFKSLDEAAVKKITLGYEGLNKKLSPMNMIKKSNNRGKKVLISLCDNF
ncbi:MULTISPECIES: BLUF domain-containing protein [Psychromonas]|uniref:BLUF domain-containing protein n=1 Tax=Psychromonas TaxID=67572 RepID=UPI000417566A|nr:MULTISPECIES: BLUF domain-containing protein [Psychromonas]MBB1274427.1 BLUF domain-containing protein [Psychromonas sp. SR45-3]